MTAPKPHPKAPTGPKLHSVESKMVKAIGWQPEKPKADTGTLHVQFHDGTVYEYDRVPEQRMKRFMEAPSKGAFLHHQIKSHFDGRKRGS